MKRWVGAWMAMVSFVAGGGLALADDFGKSESVKDDYACVLHDKHGVIERCVVTSLADCQRLSRVHKLEYIFTRTHSCEPFKKGLNIKDVKELKTP